MRGRTETSRVSLSFIGGLLLALAAASVVYGVRAALAQAWYREAKYGRAAENYERGLALCRRAFALYPFNYYMSIFVAERAYYSGESMSGPGAEERLWEARLWCERGLAQNRWDSQLRRLMTRFLLLESPVRAVQFWEEHTAWQFWEPYNHAVLAELYVRAGELDKAEKELFWAGGDPSVATTKELIQREREKQQEALIREIDGWGE